MSNVDMAEFSMEKYLQDMPYEILYEIFRTITKGRLVEISKLCSRFRDIAGDIRLWKNVRIIYKSNREQSNAAFTFEELHSEPWPVKMIDLYNAKINPPVSPQIDQVVKVTKLALSSSTADEVTIEAILTKYKCTELYLELRCIYYNQHHVMGIKPEAFSKQTSLEVLSLKGIVLDRHCQLWLAPALSYCKNLKTLDLPYLEEVDIMSLVKKLPKSLEKLFLIPQYFKNSILKLLAKSIPNLRELGTSPLSIECPPLLEFRLLEILHFIWRYPYIPYINTSVFHMYLKKFPALKTVYIKTDGISQRKIHKRSLEELQRTLELHGIIVGRIEEAKEGPSVDNNLWEMSKTV